MKQFPPPFRFGLHAFQSNLVSNHAKRRSSCVSPFVRQGRCNSSYFCGCARALSPCSPACVHSHCSVLCPPWAVSLVMTHTFQQHLLRTYCASLEDSKLWGYPGKQEMKSLPSGSLRGQEGDRNQASKHIYTSNAPRCI